MCLFGLLFGGSGGSGNSSGEKCQYYRGSFCGIASSDAISDKCTNGHYSDCYYFQTRYSRSESFEQD